MSSSLAPLTINYALFSSGITLYFGGALKELFYFGIDDAKRFQSKLFIDLILASVPSYAAALTSITVLALTSKSVLENISVFAALFIGSMFLALCGLFCLNRILKRGAWNDGCSIKFLLIDFLRRYG